MVHALKEMTIGFSMQGDTNLQWDLTEVERQMEWAEAVEVPEMELKKWEVPATRRGLTGHTEREGARICVRCGILGHEAMHCDYGPDVRCQVCKKTGHIQSACWWSGFSRNAATEVSELDVMKGHEDWQRAQAGLWPATSYGATQMGNYYRGGSSGSGKGNRRY